MTSDTKNGFYHLRSGDLKSHIITHKAEYGTSQCPPSQWSTVIRFLLTPCIQFPPHERHSLLKKQQKPSFMPQKFPIPRVPGLNFGIDTSQYAGQNWKRQWSLVAHCAEGTLDFSLCAAGAPLS
ncbi:hypothetical protein JTE90_013044 [Oedothorax gibbosus]|uniref:Uncharacterized protein n=1 Tax=Oedothorax gibbosus TaxID=931172 RepID=A0AAV6UHT7_9ARAC|nr:hypothetical protein JTE90_013044 [Oedothorax gibbosus]